MRVKALLILLLALLAGQVLASTAHKHSKSTQPAATAASQPEPDGLTVISDKSLTSTAAPYDKPVASTTGAAASQAPAIKTAVPWQSAAAPATPVVVEEGRPAASTSAPLPVWRAASGSTLRGVLAEWSARAGYKPPLWDSPALDTCDFPIVGDLTYSGSFEDAVSKLLPPYGEARTCAIRGHIYTKQRLVHIEAK